MTITSSNSTSAAAYYNQLDSTTQSSSTSQSNSTTQAGAPLGPPPGPPPSQGSGGASSPPTADQMKAIIAKLQPTDPTLAAKLTKISSTLQQLQKSGVSQQDAMQTIQSEFGKPTDTEMNEISTAMQQLQTGHQVDTTA